MSGIEESVRIRLAVLEHAYEANDEFSGDDLKGVIPFASDAEIEAAVQYLLDEGLLEAVALGNVLEISHAGRKEYERLLTKKNEPTLHFPAFNVIHVGQMIQSQIQQGVEHSHQSQANATDLNVAAIRDLIAEIRGASIDLTPTDRSTLDSDLATIEAQLVRPTPKRQFIRESLTSARVILEGAGGGLLAAAVTELLKALR